MKKILLILFVFVQIYLHGEVIEKTYYFDNYNISEIDGYQILEFENTQQQAKTGYPVLPYMSVSLLLPPGKAAESIEFIGSHNTQVPGNYNLYPQQMVRPVSQQRSGRFTKDIEVYNSSEKYPQQQTGQLITQFLHGYAFALNTFTPALYTPSERKLSYYKEVKLIITTKPNIKAEKALDNLISNEHVLERINKIAQNAQDISKYPQINSREDEYKLLIVTPAQFQSEFDEMQEVYLKQGMISEVITTENIYSSTPGQDDQEKIRNYIIQEYQDHQIEHVLLAGDVEHVPYRGFYCTVASGTGYEDDDIPSDLYYSALDGTWNDDGDNYWGEIGEDDLLPEVAVARFSFSSLDDLENMLNKTINYQTQPVLAELRDPLLAGENMYNDPLTWGGDYLDLLIGFHDDNGYETTGIPEDHNITKMYDRDMGTWSGTELIAEINQGHSFIHHAGHSNYEYAMRLNNSDITNTNFNLINGVDHNYTFVYTHGCNCGSFDHNDGIGERMINIENLLVAFVGNSRYGWFNEGQTEGPSAHIHREFIDALYSDKYHRIGRAHMESKTETAPWLTAPGQHEEGAIRWCFYDCNVLGGSALPVWTDEPLNIDATYTSIIPLGSSEFVVNIQNSISPVENMQCTLLQDGVFIGTSSTNSSGDATVMFDPVLIAVGDLELYISGYNRPAEMHQLQVVPTGNFVSVTGYSVISGNDNIIEFGENTLLSLDLEEVGNTGDIHNVVVEISSADENITLNDNSENVGFIPSGGAVELIDAFDFTVADDIPNEHTILIDIEITSDEGDWNSQVELVGYNADLAINNIEVLDGENGFLDPGEVADIEINIHNLGGADLYDLISSISSNDPNLTITNLPASIDSLNAGETDNIGFSVELSEAAQSGDVIEFDLNITANNNFNFLAEFALIVGIAIEDFESGDFTAFAWEHGGDADWIIVDQAYEGAYSARTGAIGNNSMSSISIELEISSEGEISFWKKVSTELDYDYFKFFIDDNLHAEWSGEVDWSESVFSVDSGIHIFKWEYYKDGGVTGGSDCAWLDYVIFPPITGEVDAGEELLPKVSRFIGNYPNPFNPSTTISFDLASESNVSVAVYNIKGQKIKTLMNDEFEKGKHSVIWNGIDGNNKPVSSGIYLYRIKSRGLDQTKKMILIK